MDRHGAPFPRLVMSRAVTRPTPGGAYALPSSKILPDAALGD